jgi:hypothetical protein
MIWKVTEKQTGGLAYFKSAEDANTFLSKLYNIAPMVAVNCVVSEE